MRTVAIVGTSNFSRKIPREISSARIFNRDKIRFTRKSDARNFAARIFSLRDFSTARISGARKSNHENFYFEKIQPREISIRENPTASKFDTRKSNRVKIRFEKFRARISVRENPYENFRFYPLQERGNSFGARCPS